MNCPHCHTEASPRAFVCTGCQAEIIYGATLDENKHWMIGGAILGAIAGAYIRSSFGLSLWALGIGAAAGGITGVVIASQLYGNSVRFFRRYRHR